MSRTELFAQRLREQREAMRLTQGAVAQACGWESQSRISMYERAEREPSLSDIHKLADALQTTACDLIGQPTDNPYYIAEDKADYNATPLFAEDIKDITAEFIDEYMKGLLKNMDTRKQIDIIIGLLTALKDPGMRQVSPATILKLISMVG